MKKPRAASLVLALALAACERRAEPAPAPQPVPARPARPAAAPTVAVGPTLTAVRARGRVNCGVHPGLPGFAFRDTRGVWRGFDADFCRAVAAAVLGNAEAVRFVPLSIEERFAALREGRVDLLSRSTSVSFSRDVGGGLDFPAITYHDGQGFLIRRGLGVEGAAELNGARICVQTGSSSEVNLRDWSAARGIQHQPVLLPSEEQARAAYEAQQCEALSADISALASARSILSQPTAHLILPDVLSKEPLGPVVREDDPTWADAVRWTRHALVLAEELGVTSRNAEQMRDTSADPDVRRLLGAEGREPAPGVRPDWAFQAVSRVGNYGEIFERNLGAETPLRLRRGLNAQWTAEPPGLLYAPPVR